MHQSNVPVFLTNQSGLRSTHRSTYISTKILTKSHRSISDTKNCLCTCYLEAQLYLFQTLVLTYPMNRDPELVLTFLEKSFTLSKLNLDLKVVTLYCMHLAM